MKDTAMIGFSKRNWQDAYYDGYIGNEQGYDEDIDEVFDTYDYWGFNITKSEKGYIEDLDDDWYLDLMNGRIESNYDNHE